MWGGVTDFRGAGGEAASVCSWDRLLLVATVRPPNVFDLTCCGKPGELQGWEVHMPS